jgi:hypothetical protein
MSFKEEQDAMWEVFDTMLPQENWTPSPEELFIIDKIAKVLKELVYEQQSAYI